MTAFRRIVVRKATSADRLRKRKYFLLTAKDLKMVWQYFQSDSTAKSWLNRQHVSFLIGKRRCVERSVICSTMQDNSVWCTDHGCSSACSNGGGTDQRSMPHSRVRFLFKPFWVLKILSHSEEHTSFIHYPTQSAILGPSPLNVFPEFMRNHVIVLEPFILPLRKSV